MALIKFENGNTLTEKQEKAILFLLQKDELCMSYEDVAAEIGISERQLRRWRYENENFQQELGKRSIRATKNLITDAYRYTKNALNSNTTRESTGIKAAELVFKANGILKEVQEVTKTEKISPNAVDEALRAYGITSKGSSKSTEESADK